MGARRYKDFPTLENNLQGDFFRYEPPEAVTKRYSHIIDNLKFTDEEQTIATNWDIGFAEGDYILDNFGKMWRVRQIQERWDVAPQALRSALRAEKDILLTMNAASNPLELKV